MSREVLKVLCAKNNRLGTVIADADGYAVEYTANVVHRGSVFPSPRRVIDRLSRDEVASLAAYCRACNRPVTLSVRALLRAIDERKLGYHAPFADDVNGPWGGRKATDPGNEARLKDDPRAGNGH